MRLTFTFICPLLLLFVLILSELEVSGVELGKNSFEDSSSAYLHEKEPRFEGEGVKWKYIKGGKGAKKRVLNQRTASSRLVVMSVRFWFWSWCLAAESFHLYFCAFESQVEERNVLMGVLRWFVVLQSGGSCFEFFSSSSFPRRILKIQRQDTFQRVKKPKLWKESEWNVNKNCIQINPDVVLSSSFEGWRIYKFRRRRRILFWIYERKWNTHS